MKITPTNLPDGFTRWWATYPRKSGKGQAVRAWVKNDCESITDEIIKATKTYPFSTDKHYVPMPSTWINGWRWLDQHDDGGSNGDW